MSTFHKLTVEEIKIETANAVSILFTVPIHLKEAFKFKAGQYITIKTTLNGQEVRRAYSLCSSPQSGEVRIAVKAIENGFFSVFATSKLQKGTVLEVAEPEGKFILEPKKHKNYIGFAAGSGITPILSMIKAVIESTSTVTFTLIYGNKTVKNTIFYDELNALSTKHPQQFKLHFIFSREQFENTLFGRIDKGNCNYFIKNIYEKITFDKAFLCGPEEMIETVSKTLQENGILKGQIHFELFSVSDSEESLSKIPKGKSAVTIFLDDEEYTFVMKTKDDLLAAALRNDIDAPYSCQGGVCSSCLAIVKDGKAIMVKNSILSDEEIAQGYILTCQAHPTTSKITIDFDDV